MQNLDLLRSLVDALVVAHGDPRVRRLRARIEHALDLDTPYAVDTRTALGAQPDELTCEAAARVVRERDEYLQARDNAYARERAAHAILCREGVPAKSAELGGHDGTIPVRLEWLFGNRHVEAAARRDLARVQAALDAAGVDKTGDSASRIERLAAWRERESKGRIEAQGERDAHRAQLTEVAEALGGFRGGRQIKLAAAVRGVAQALVSRNVASNVLAQTERPVVHVDLDDARMTAQVTVGGHVIAKISACQRPNRIGGVSYGVQLQGSPDLVGIGHGT